MTFHFPPILHDSATAPATGMGREFGWQSEGSARSSIDSCALRITGRFHTSLMASKVVLFIASSRLYCRQKASSTGRACSRDARTDRSCGSDRTSMSPRRVSTGVMFLRHCLASPSDHGRQPHLHHHLSLNNHGLWRQPTPHGWLQASDTTHSPGRLLVDALSHSLHSPRAAADNPEPMDAGTATNLAVARANKQ